MQANCEEEITSATGIRLEEYLQTQSILAETLETGKGTAQQLSLQQSSLDRAQEIVAETEYYVETSNRWIRGRTWAGWITNLLTSPPLPPSTTAKGKSSTDINPSQTSGVDEEVAWRTEDYSSLYELEKFPPPTWKTVQSVQNYHSHVLLLRLEQQNGDNFSTLLDVCQSLQSYAKQQLQHLMESHPTTHIFLLHQMEQLDAYLNQFHFNTKNTHGDDATSTKVSSTNSTTPISSSSSLRQQHQQQENYLNSLLPGLEELHNISEAIGSSLHHQNQILDKLNQKTEELADQTQLVIRRSERLIDKSSFNSILQHKSWELRQDRICILHCATNQYILIDDSFKMTWSNTLSQATVFHLFQCRHFYAFQNVYSRKWLGIVQSFFGTTTVSCSATTRGSQEVWEFDDDCTKESLATTTTRLLSSNANWGTGGYIQVHENNTIIPQRKSSSFATIDLWKIIPC